ncbi:hypothetical protein MMCCUG48898_0030 [Mycobacteroides abscessus subsp. massiliense CCUG 48898 = JCM 15300]|nr:hypothetical protein MMCCUG48898_0030 [Mycobacteroides abscessus subsp. massiliense CCUG 48898 = JCM 15300]BAP95016.1 hypothetical protein MMASJCM_0240 [Mycobacteroides abscessus subsp. massiliense CCUG 48898 = JCM 15300]
MWHDHGWYRQHSAFNGGSFIHEYDRQQFVGESTPRPESVQRRNHV